MFCRGRVQIDHKESVTNSPILVKCDFYSSLYVFFAVYLCCCSCLSVGQLFCLSRGLLACLCLSSLSFNLSVSLSGILSVWRCFYRSVCLSSLHLSLSVSYSVCLSSLSVSRLSVTLSVCLSSYLCVSCCRFQFYHCKLQQLSIYSFLLISCM